MKRPALWIMTAILAFATVVCYMGGIKALQTEHLPFGMEHELHTNAILIGVLFLVLAVLMTGASYFLFRLLLTGRGRSPANWLAFGSWVLALFIFIYGVGASGVEWVFFFLFTIPAFVCWIMTGASIKLPGEEW